MTASRLTTTMSAAKERVINHAAGSHGVSGIFVKYDTSSLMVTVSEQHMPLWQFLVRLCGIIGGIFSTTGEWAWTFRAKQLNMVLALNSCSYFILFFFFYCALLTFKGCFTGSLASVLMSSAAASNWDSTGPERC